MNEHSSRSHAIFTITIECSEKGMDGNQHVRMGKLHLVDLAVCDRPERPKKNPISGNIELKYSLLSLNHFPLCLPRVQKGRARLEPQVNV